MVRRSGFRCKIHKSVSGCGRTRFPHRGPQANSLWRRMLWRISRRPQHFAFRALTAHNRVNRMRPARPRWFRTAAWRKTSRPTASRTTNPVFMAGRGWQVGASGIGAPDVVRVAARHEGAFGRVISFSGGSGRTPGRVSEGAE